MHMSILKRMFYSFLANLFGFIGLMLFLLSIVLFTIWFPLGILPLIISFLFICEGGKFAGLIEEEESRVYREKLERLHPKRYSD